MFYNYEEFNNNVLVPMMRDDYRQLMRMFGVPFRSVDTSVSGYMVNMHMKQARLVHNLAELLFECMYQKSTDLLIHNVDIDIEGFIDRGRFLCVVLFL